MKTINIVSIPKPMTDERLDEIYLLADIFAKSRRLDVIHELLTELKRLRSELKGDDPVNPPKLCLGGVRRTDDDCVHIRLNDIFDLKIVKTDEGVVLDLLPVSGADASLATAFASDQEALDKAIDVS